MRNVIFGERIKEQRNQLQLTQADVAKKLFTTRQTISNWEKGKSYPDLSTLIKISDFYHVSIDSLLREDQELKKSLERDTVERKYGIISGILSLSCLLTLLLSMLLNKTTAYDNPLTRWLIVGILLCDMAVSLLDRRFKTYISGSKLNKKIIIKIIVGVLLGIVVLFSAIYFSTGQQFTKSLHYLSYVLFTISVLITVIVISMLTLNRHSKKHKNKDDND